MKRAFLVTNVLLMAAIVVTACLLHQRAANARALQKALTVKNASRLLSRAALPPVPPPVSPKTYVADAVQRFLFSPDRNPNVIEAEATPPQMPPLPSVYGILNFEGNQTIILGTTSSSQRAYHAGEQAGAFKLIRFDSRTIAFEWNGKEITRPLQELTGRPAPAVSPSAASSDTAVLAPPPNRSESKLGQMGPALNPTERACVAGDNLAAGAVSDGFTKVVTKTPFGPICRWTK